MATGITVNPLTWKSFNLSNENPHVDSQMYLFQQQLGDFGNQTQSVIGSLQNSVGTLQNSVGVLQTSAGLGAILNGSGVLTITALKAVVVNSYPQISNLTVACDGATSVFVFTGWTSSTSTLVLLTHLGFGVPVTVQFANNFSSALNYAIQATDPGGTNYGEVGATFATSVAGSSFVNLTPGTTSLTNGNRVTYTGMSGGALGAGRLYFNGG